MQKFDGKLYIGTFDTASLLEPIGSSLMATLSI